MWSEDRMAKMTIGFIGAGQMARALASGFVAAELVSADGIVAFDPVAEAASQFAELVPGSRIVASNRAVVEAADVIVLAVKPQCISDVMQDLDLAQDKFHRVLFISIIAGTPLPTLCAGLKSDRVVRVMPNTPCLVGAGAAGYALGPGASIADGELVGRLMGAVGIAFPVPESQLDAVTGLSGSGPAYVYTCLLYTSPSPRD